MAGPFLALPFVNNLNLENSEHSLKTQREFSWFLRPCFLFNKNFFKIDTNWSHLSFWKTIWYAGTYTDQLKSRIGRKCVNHAVRNCLRRFPIQFKNELVVGRIPLHAHSGPLPEADNTKVYRLIIFAWETAWVSAFKNFASYLENAWPVWWIRKTLNKNLCYHVIGLTTRWWKVSTTTHGIKKSTSDSCPSSGGLRPWIRTLRNSVVR